MAPDATKTEVALFVAYIASLIVMAWVMIAIFTPIAMPPRWLALPAALVFGYLGMSSTFDVFDARRRTS